MDKSSQKDVIKKLLPKPFPIVGIGASAGGIEAFTRLLEHLDTDLGMAYVFVMHLPPRHKSALAEIVQTKTRMPVHTVTDGMELMRNNIYIIPPNTFMSVVDGHLKLAPRSLTEIGNFAVDYFLIALASVYKNNAIGVILSGTATDGTLGLKAVKAEGGITFAQDESAKFSGMPRNAYDSGYVDFRLPPEGIAEELARLINVPYTSLRSDEIESVQKEELDAHTEDLKKILAIVKARFGIDFFLNYKHASIYRRMVRRMVLNKLENLHDYTTLLQNTPKEVDALYDDFLINVTSFFRDPDFYGILNKKIFPALIKERSPSDPIRIWVAGCSTGEEAYSITICLLDFLKARQLSFPIQIFASDLDKNAIEKARVGIYPISSLQGITGDHLKKYFIRKPGYYQVVKAVRELCIFSQQNMLRDPPFSRLDLISCQNVLIYLESHPQTRILQTFHYALKPAGFLFLGKSESIGSSADLFEQLDKKIRVFSRNAMKSPRLEFTLHSADTPSFKSREVTEQGTDVPADREIEKLLLSRYVPPCIVVNKNLMIVHFFGIISPYLEPVTGKASLNVLKIIRTDLVVHLGSLLQKARRTDEVAFKDGIITESNKALKAIAIEVAPVKNPSGDIAFIILFKEHSITEPKEKSRSVKVARRSDSAESTIQNLERQLSESRSLIRASNEEYETTYEELQAYNEEILSSNEELQSVNEELETSKEELQSAIEELSTTNDELVKRNIELKQSQTYAEAIVETVHNPLLVLTSNLQIRMANKAFYRMFSLTQEKTEGCFIYELGENAWEIPSLRKNLNDLLEKQSSSQEFEVRHFFTGLGDAVLNVNAYIMSKADGLSETLILLSFNNISDLLKANKELKKVNEQLADFAFVSSHHLQEPMRKIQVFADYLDHPEASLNEFSKNYVKKIKASCSRMSTLVRDLLSFSLLSQAEKMLLTVDLTETFRNVIHDFEDVILIKKATVNVSDLPLIHAEPSHMSQLFANLISNALTFSKENPVINVTSRGLSDEEKEKHGLSLGTKYVAVEICDNGIGFDQKYAHKVFTLFQRLDNVNGKDGSGVGLAICKRIVEDHGGIILAEATEDIGATFTVILPEGRHLAA